jgi:MFS family permease
MPNNIHKSYAAAFLKNLQFFGAITIPFFLDWIRIDYARAFILQAWFVFWSFALEIPTGVVADKVGRKFSVGLGCFLFAVDMLMFGTITDYYLLYVAEFLGAAGMTMISGAEQALLYDSLIELQLENRARFYLAKYEAAGTMGLLLAFPLGSLVAGMRKYPAGLPLPFNMTAAAGIAAALIFFWMLEPRHRRPEQGFFMMGVQGLRTLFVHRSLRAFVLNAVTISSVTFFAFWFYQPAGQRAGLKLAHLGFFAAGFNLFSAFLLSNVRRLERTFGIRRLLLYSALIPAVLFLSLAAEHHLAFVVPAFCLIVGCKMVRMPILNEFINRRIESENRATVISSVSLLERFATFVFYPLVGFLADISLDYAFLVLGGLCAAFAVATKISEVHLAEGSREQVQNTP